MCEYAYHINELDTYSLRLVQTGKGVSTLLVMTYEHDEFVYLLKLLFIHSF